MFSSMDTVTAGVWEQVTALAGLGALVTVVVTLRLAVADKVLDEGLAYLLVSLTCPLL